MIKVKICGIKKLEDALAAIRFGADAIGLLVGQKHPSNDFIDVETARAVVQALPPFCSSVLVTHLSSAEEIVTLARQVGTNTIQLHGDSTASEAAQIKQSLPFVKLYKSIHVIDEQSIETAKSYLNAVDGILLDTINKTTGQVGGTGKTHDWTISKRMVAELNLPVILAGGLHPENVREAIEMVRPYAVDANSGTKGTDGYKDYAKLKSFIERAKSL